MYKVFINDKPIVLTDTTLQKKGFEVYNFETVVIDELVHKLKKNKTKGIILFCKDLSKCWTFFKEYFPVVEAGGGLVLNEQKQVLFIYRGNKWDLPKGRIEKGEHIETTAIREVEEECGVQELELKKFLITTYHLFYQDRVHKLKITHWYLMHTQYKGSLTPQKEEGITIAEFKNQNLVPNLLNKSFANIKLVFDAFGSKE